MMDAKNGAHATGRLADWGRNLISLFRDTSGNVIIIVAVTAPILLGTAALGFDVISWYMMKRDAQTIADNAALAAAVQLRQGGDTAAVKKAAEDHLLHSGFVAGTDGTVIVNVPPQAGPHIGDDQFVEVIIEQAGTYLLSAAMFKSDSTTIQSRAVGGLYSGGNYCVLALETTAANAVEFAGNSTAELNSCSVASNSTNVNAMSISGNNLTADIAQAVGGINYDPANLTLTYDPPREGAPPVPDPYADVVIIPDPTTKPPCDYTKYDSNDGDVLNRGVYCGDLKINASDTVTFSPGVYYIRSDGGSPGDFVVNAGATVNGTDVTFILTDDKPEEIGTFKINGNATLNLAAPPNGHTYGPYNGDYAGILMIVDGRAPNGLLNTFNGGADMTMQGAIYAPSTQITFSGGADINVGCLQVIGRTVTFTGNSHVTAIRDDCGALGTNSVGLHLPSLFE